MKKNTRFFTPTNHCSTNFNSRPFSSSPILYAGTKVTSGYTNHYRFPNNFDYNSNEGILKEVSKFLASLEDNKVYSILPVIISEGELQSDVKIIVKKASKITKQNTPKSVQTPLSNGIKSYLSQYSLSDSFDLVISYKIWLSNEDFNVPLEKVTQTLESLLVTNTISNSDSRDLILDRVDFKKVLNEFAITTPGNYGVEVTDFKSFDSTTLNYKKINSKIYKCQGLCLEVVQMDDEYLVDVLFKNEKGQLSFSEYPTISWTDSKSKNFRKFLTTTIYYKENLEVDFFDTAYKFPNYPSSESSKEYNGLIGAFDFETMSAPTKDKKKDKAKGKDKIKDKDKGNDGVLEQVAYCVGYAAGDTYQSFYLYDNPTLNSEEDLVNQMMASMLENFNKYTFYAHNLGSFDAFFLLKVLIHNENYVVTPFWKDNKILSIKVVEKKTKKYIKFHDSLQLIPGTLDSILKTFKSDVKKGVFPYSFITPETVKYIGNKPLKQFYNSSVTMEEYNAIPNENWSCRNESLRYLKGDVLGLQGILQTFSLEMFEKFRVNITNYRTLPSMVMAIFTNKFYNESHEIKVIKGIVEKDIRCAYKGGVVDVYKHEVKNGYYYDVNSQYPFAMLNDMPVGNPIFSTEVKLEKYFGFVFADVIAPKAKELRVGILQSSEKNLPVTSNNESEMEFKVPRRTFSGWYFSEELKNAEKYGYKCQVICGYKFNRGKDVFRDYIETVYQDKVNATSPVGRLVAKLMLNSLYGKFGQLEKVETMKILESNSKEFKEIMKNKHFTLLSDLGRGKIIVRYSGKIPEKLRKLIVNQDIEDDKKLVPNRSRGVQAAVQVAAAISSYARIGISEFKNIADNDCVYSDTDSVVLEKPLNKKFVGERIGQMKLECIVKTGIFLAKKRYYILTSEGKEIKKAAGVKGDQLKFSDYRSLLYGNNVVVENITFRKKWGDLSIQIDRGKKKIKGVNRAWKK